jgi:AraC-like DNA-binding protein
MNRLPLETRFNQIRQVLKDGPLRINTIAYRMGYSHKSSLSWLLYRYGLPKGVKRQFDASYGTRGAYWYYLEETALKRAA